MNLQKSHSDDVYAGLQEKTGTESVCNGTDVIQNQYQDQF